MLRGGWGEKEGGGRGAEANSCARQLIDYDLKNPLTATRLRLPSFLELGLADRTPSTPSKIPVVPPPLVRVVRRPLAVLAGCARPRADARTMAKMALVLLLVPTQ